MQKRTEHLTVFSALLFLLVAGPGFTQSFSDAKRDFQNAFRTSDYARQK